MTKTGYLSFEWYARPNDIVGGWCVMPVDQPPSDGFPEVANFTTQELAEHIARLHNDWLVQQGDGAA
jgi:hypothetical protein